ncbi:MAG TPA: tetratricopeptide repeat protein [Pyrinomonadaceae bacterium]|nr:tetratricopeptide repeat protein [Pyrinomonadaceae bacterium]
MPSELQPYVGPRPFEREEGQRFFGRERESSELLSRVIAHPAVLLYSQSGAGKTSLLNASLIPLLEKEGFEILPTARVRGLAPKDIPAEDIPNLYVFNVLMSWTGGTADPRLLAKMTIADFLNSEVRPMSREGMPTPRVAVFDQFEELFTFYPERWNDRQNFFDQVSEALERDRLMRIIFVMREDYIAELDPYVSDLPEKLRTRFRLERLREDAALEAVTEPLDGTGYSFAGGVAEQLVNNLLEVPVETAAGVATVVGEFVEPVQLQVVCQTLWQKLDHSDNKEITFDQLKAFGDVDLALSDFYETAIITVSSETGVNEGLLRRWFEHTLITTSRTRGTVFRGRQETGGIPNAAVDKLVDQHLIRGEVRGGARWYELTHDRLIEPIITSNQQWMLQRSGAEQTRQRLEKRAAEWVRNGRPNSGLLDEAELLEARRWLESPNADDVGYSEALFALVQASRAAVEEVERQRERLLTVEQQRRAEAEHARVEEQQRHIEEQARGAKRLRRLVAALAVMFLLAIATAGYAVNRSRVATSETMRAQQKEHEANAALAAVKKEKERADDQTKIANRETLLAEERKNEAEKQTSLAESRKDEAEKAKQIATAALKKAKENAKAKEELTRIEKREAEREKADVIVSSANALYRSDNLPEAIEKYREGLSIYKGMEDKNGEVEMLINIAVLYSQLARRTRGMPQQANFAQSMDYFNRAWDLEKAREGAESGEVARVQNYIGVAYEGQHNYDQARSYYEQALEIRKKIPDNDSDLALLYSNLGGAFQQLDMYPEAQTQFELAVEIRRKTLATDDVGLVQSYNRIASVEASRGHTFKAEGILKNSLEIINKASPATNRDLEKASTRNLLGLTYFYQGRFADALVQYQEALALSRQARGMGSSQEATYLHNLALASLGLANYAEAEAFERGALAIYEKSPEQNDETLALGHTTLARIRREQNKYTEAESLFNQALEEMKDVKGGGHSRVATILHYMAQFHAVRLEYDKAEKYENDALAIYKKKLEPQHWYIARSLGTLATIYAGQRRSAETESAYKQSIEGLELAFGPHHPEVAYSVNGLARFYVDQGRYPEAEPLMKRALSVRQEMLGKEHPAVAETLENYAALLRKTNRGAEATQMEARAKAIRAKYSLVDPCK